MAVPVSDNVLYVIAFAVWGLNFFVLTCVVYSLVKEYRRLFK